MNLDGALNAFFPIFKWSDATSLIDAIKAIKSEDELEFIRKTAEMQDRLVDEVRGFIRPGLRDFEVMAFAQYKANLFGSEQGYFLGTSASQDGAPLPLRRPYQGRLIQEGDIFFFQAENPAQAECLHTLAGYSCLVRPSKRLSICSRQPLQRKSLP